MRVLVTATALLAALGLAACTGDDSNGSPTSAAPSTSTTRSDSSTPPAPVEHVTAFTKAWSWQVLPPDRTGLNAHAIDDAVLDGDRIVMAQVARTNPLGFVGSRTTIVSADLGTRKAVWTATLKGEPQLLQVVGHTVVVHLRVGVGSDDGTSPLYGFDASTGTQRWHKTVGPGVAVLGTSVVVGIASGGRVTTHRFAADTGQDVASSDGYPAAPLGAAGERIVFADGAKLTAYDAELKAQAWTAGTSSSSQVQAYVVGDAVIVAPQDAGSHDVTAYDLDTGARRWQRAVQLDSEVRDASVAGDELLLHTDGAMTAFAADGTTWTVPESAVAKAGSSGGNTLACDRSLVSLAPDGGLYGYTDLPADDFSNLGCRVAPLLTSPESVLPDAAVVVGETGIVAYRLTAQRDPATKPDGFGRWGALDPHACTAPFTTAMAGALDAALEPRWWLIAADSKHCVWRNHHSFPVAATTRLASAAQARAYLDPTNSQGGCRVAGWTGGSEAAVPTRGAGLPAGSGICALLGSSKGGQPENDLFTGVTRARDGTWAAITLLYPYGKGKDFTGGAKLLALLRRLAG